MLWVLSCAMDNCVGLVGCFVWGFLYLFLGGALCIGGWGCVSL